MAMLPSSSLNFTVRRQEPVLVAPARPTPHDFKRLSDIDDQEGLRCHMPMILFYRDVNIHHLSTGAGGRDPAKVIRDALAKALVFYYPLAGRLREVADRKLVVECTGEGVVFIEAHADVRLEQFGDALQPPFPCLEELLYDAPGTGGILGCPLLLIQVTRMLCGGFILGLRVNHAMCGPGGLVQFMNAVAEFACGAAAPSVFPAWARELLEARKAPRVTCIHQEYKNVPDTKGTTAIIPLVDLVQRNFFFGAPEITALRKHLPAHLRKSTVFEILTACLWKCRTIAIGPDPEEEVRVICAVKARGLGLPTGFYGNDVALPAAVSTADKIMRNPLGYALGLIRKAKSDVTDEYMQSAADLMVLKGRPHYTTARSCLVTDLSRAGFRDVDFGWGKAVYGGPARADASLMAGVTSIYVAFTNTKGEDGILVTVCLQKSAMEIFVVEIDSLVHEQPMEKQQLANVNKINTVLHKSPRTRM